MDRAREIIRKIAQETRKVILFHSASGKDSIALLHLLSQYFDEIICVYMYVVQDLEHINRYINYATSKYQNVRYYQVPHYALASSVKYGYMGHACNPKQRLYNLADITDKVREQFGIDWVFYGFKQSDSMNRRLMLRTYEHEAINYDTKKCYPLSTYKNSDVLEYIEHKGLVKPESYGKGQSAGTNITDIGYLLFLRNNYPSDLQKVLSEFPDVERLLFEYDYKNGKEGTEAK